MGRALGLSLLLTSCSFDAGVSALQEVRCASNLECPPGLLCQTHRQRCRPTEGFDDTPPALLSSALKLVPLEAGALVPTAWGPTSTLAVSAALSEPVVHLALQLTPPIAADCALRVEQLQVSASCALAGPVGEVPIAFALEAIDGAGLAATLPLGTLQVDDVAPAAPDVDTEGVTLLVQAPFGSLADPLASVELQVKAAPSVALEVFQGASQVLRLETNFEASGPLRARLPASSAVTMVRSVDAAGNRSSLVPVRWVDTLAAPQPQLRYDSPHRAALDEVGTGVGAPLDQGLGAGQTVLGKARFQAALREQTYVKAPPVAPGIEPWSRRRILDTWPPQFQSGDGAPQEAWAGDGGTPVLTARLVDVHRRAVWFAEAWLDSGGWVYTAHQVEGAVHRVVGTSTQPFTSPAEGQFLGWSLKLAADRTGLFLSRLTTVCKRISPSIPACLPSSSVDTTLAFRDDAGLEVQPLELRVPFEDEPDTVSVPAGSTRRLRTTLPDGGELLLALSRDGEASCLAGQEPPVCATLERGDTTDAVRFPSGAVLPVPLAQWGGLRLLADGGVLVVQPAGSGAGLQTQVFPDGGSLPLRAFPGVPSLTAATTQGTLYLIADGGYAVLEDGAGLSVEALPPMNLPALNGLAPGGRVTVDGEGRVHFFDDRRWLERVGPSTWRERPLDGEQPPNSTRWVSLVWSSNHGFLSNTDRLEWQRLRPNVRLSASVPAAGLPSGSLRRVWLETVGSAESAAADGGTSQALVLSTWLAGRLVRGTPSPSPLRFEVPQPQLIEIPEDTLTWVIEPEGTNFADRPARLQVDGAQVRFRTFTP